MLVCVALWCDVVCCGVLWCDVLCCAVMRDVVLRCAVMCDVVDCTSWHVLWCASEVGDVCYRTRGSFIAGNCACTVTYVVVRMCVCDVDTRAIVARWV